MDSSYWSIHGQAIILIWKQLSSWSQLISNTSLMLFSLEQKRPLKVDAASALNIPVKEVSDLLVVSQDRAKRFELTPVWAPVEPPTKRAKTAEVRLSSASNVPMPPTKDDNEKGSSDEEDSNSSGSNSDVSSQDDSSDVSDLEKFDEAYTDFQCSHERSGPTNAGTGWISLQHPSSNLSTCLLAALSGMVNLANGQDLGTLARE